MFENFPKKRIELPESYKAIYLEHYKKNRTGATPATFFSRRLEKWMHKKIREDVADGRPSNTLEIGAGTLNHLPYENTSSYDIVEPFTELFHDSELKPQVRTIYGDIRNIQRDIRYDRVISIANFEHITNLPEVVAFACLHLTENGCLRVAMPNEGELFWKLAYTLTTGVEFRIKYGLSYSLLMKHEHLNTANEIEEVLRYFFSEHRCRVMGFSRKYSFYRFYECKVPEKQKAESYLKRSGIL